MEDETAWTDIHSLNCCLTRCDTLRHVASPGGRRVTWSAPCMRPSTMTKIPVTFWTSRTSTNEHQEVKRAEHETWWGLGWYGWYGWFMMILLYSLCRVGMSRVSTWWSQEVLQLHFSILAFRLQYSPMIIIYHNMSEWSRISRCRSFSTVVTRMTREAPPLSPSSPLCGVSICHLLPGYRMPRIWDWI